jgi:hypothetical protein
MKRRARFSITCFPPFFVCLRLILLRKYAKLLKSDCRPDIRSIMASSAPENTDLGNQPAAIPRLLEELSQMNALLKTIVADKGLDPFPRENRPTSDRVESMALLNKTIGSNPGHIRLDYEQLRLVAVQQLPKENLLHRLREMFQRVWELDCLGIAYEEPLDLWGTDQRVLGEAVLQLCRDGEEPVEIPWTNTSRIQDLAARISLTRNVENLLPSIEGLWPSSLGRQLLDVEAGSPDPLFEWWDNAPMNWQSDYTAYHEKLAFNRFGYMQTIDVSRLVIPAFGLAIVSLRLRVV